MPKTELRPRRLKRRMALLLIAYSLIGGALAGVALWVADVFVEDAGIRDLLEHELDFRLAHPEIAMQAASDDPLRFIAAAAAPEAVRGLAPGYHGEILLDDRLHNVLVPPGPEPVGYLVYDMSFIERRERVVLALVIAVFAGMTLLSALLAGRLVERGLRPLNELVRAVRALDPERHGTRLPMLSGDRDVGVIADAINHYMRRLDAVLVRERAFAAAASHELRTPIAVIQGASETLALQGPQPALARIDRAVTMLRHELDALLALARIDDAPVVDALNLGRTLRELAEPYLETAPRVRVQWHIDAATTVRAPLAAITAIFTNLLRNALRAAPGGCLRIHVGDWGFRLEDEGSGIASADLPRVFEPGFRARDGGTGMGLYIAKSLAERLGWTLTLRNRDEGGAAGELRFASERSA